MTWELWLVVVCLALYGAGNIATVVLQIRELERRHAAINELKRLMHKARE
jgi:hypothetical protein